MNNYYDQIPIDIKILIGYINKSYHKYLKQYNKGLIL